MAHKIWNSGIALNEIWIDGRVVGYIHSADKAKSRIMAYREDGSTMGYLSQTEYGFVFEAIHNFHAHEFHGKQAQLSKN